MGSLLAGVCVFGTDWRGVECGNKRGNICALTQVFLLCFSRVGFFFSWHKSGKNNKCHLLRIYYMLGISLYTASSMLRATLWSGYYSLCVTGEKTRTWRWLVPGHTAGRQQTKSKWSLSDPKLVGFFLFYDFTVVLWPLSASLTSKCFVSDCFGFKSCLALIHLVSDLYLSWKTYLNIAKIQL